MPRRPIVGFSGIGRIIAAQTTRIMKTAWVVWIVGAAISWPTSVLRADMDAVPDQLPAAATRSLGAMTQIAPTYYRPAIYRPAVVPSRAKGLWG